MKRAGGLLFAVSLIGLSAGQALAQSPFPPAGTNTFGGAPPAQNGLFPPAGQTSLGQGGPSPGGQGPTTKSGKSCVGEFTTLQEERQKRGSVLQAAQHASRKPTREEFCGMIKNFNATEVKLVRFMEDNNTACGIPAQAVAQLKGVNAKTAKMVKQVCSTNGGPAGAPPPPSLSDALGMSAVPGAKNTKTGRGTFDTLTGNPLGR